MATLANITTQEWQISAETDGLAVENLASVRQSLLLLINTQRGSVPMRPRFGVDLLGQIDSLAPAVLATISRQIIETVNLFLPSVTITDVRRAYDSAGRVSITVTWRWAGQTQTDSI